MNTRSILILIAILLFGAGVTTGVLIKSTPSTENPSSNGAEVKANELEGKSITFAPDSRGKGGVEMPGSATSFKAIIEKEEKVNKPWSVRKSTLWAAAAEGLDPSQFSQALSQVEAMKDPWERTAVRLKLLARWGESDPKAAFDYAQGLKNIREKQEALETVLDSFADKDPEGAIRCVTQLPAGYERNAAMRSLVGSLAQSDPDKAIALLDQLSPSDLLNQSQAIGRFWAESDPKAALAWANQQTDPELKASILNGVIPSMVQTDPQGALAAALSLPPGVFQDDMIRQACLQAGVKYPQAGMNVASGIGDPNLRTQAQETVAMEWLHRDRAAATQWITSSALPQEVKTRLLQLEAQQLEAQRGKLKGN